MPRLQSCPPPSLVAHLYPHLRPALRPNRASPTAHPNAHPLTAFLRAGCESAMALLAAPTGSHRAAAAHQCRGAHANARPAHADPWTSTRTHRFMPTRVPMVLPEQSIGFFFQSRKSAAGHLYSQQEFQYSVNSIGPSMAARCSSTQTSNRSIKKRATHHICSML